MDEILQIGRTQLSSRLIVGSGKYKSLEVMRRCLEVSGTSMVTVAIRRVNLQDTSDSSFRAAIPKQVMILPNTAGCYNVQDAIRTARLARELLETDLIKLEILGDPSTLLPDTELLLHATRILVKEGFTVLPYTNDDPIMAQKLVEAGAAAVMPLAAPIGSGLGILNPVNIRLIRETISSVPVIVDAGVGTASDATVAMELGIDGLLMNTAIAEAQDPVKMALAMKQATEAGRLSFLAGRIQKRFQASPSSPSQGLIQGN
ncbi:MAG: thiazole synthase [Elusimicrobia bacterium]|nr:thiazole synthase [Candidatus Obscuribacterium magneticum]